PPFGSRLVARPHAPPVAAGGQAVSRIRTACAGRTRAAADPGRHPGPPGAGERVGYVVPVMPPGTPGAEPAGAGRGCHPWRELQRRPITAQRWLRTLHDPYRLNIEDAAGTLGLDLGVYGAPETFVIDAQGVVRDKYVGVIDDAVWRERLGPLYTALLEEARP